MFEPVSFPIQSHLYQQKPREKSIIDLPLNLKRVNPSGFSCRACSPPVELAPSLESFPILAWSSWSNAKIFEVLLEIEEKDLQFGERLSSFLGALEVGEGAGDSLLGSDGCDRVERW